MNSSFGTTVARHRRPHFGHCLASGPLADQLCTSKFGEREILTAIYWGLLKQPDNQKSARACCHSAQLPSGDYGNLISEWLPFLYPKSGILAEWLNFALVVTRLNGTLVTDAFRLTRCMLSATRYEFWPPARPAEFVPVSSSPSSDAEDADGGVPRQDD